MFVFVLYAVLVWYLAARWRRQWGSFASVGAGFVGLVIVAWFHIMLNRWTDGAIYLPLLQVLLYPYTVMVVLIGLFVSCLPRSALPGHCPVCRYNLAGLEEDTTVCPECGHDSSPRPPAEPEPPATLPRIIARERAPGVTLERLATVRRRSARTLGARRAEAIAARAAVLRSPDR